MDVVQQTESSSTMNHGLSLRGTKYCYRFSLSTTEVIHPAVIFHDHPFVHWHKVLDSFIKTEAPKCRIVKRIIDIIISLIVLTVILSWLIPIVAICIKLNSAGPVFFWQKRRGYHGCIFNCIKFRTMYVNKQSDIKPVEENDPRITSFGRFLRRYYLDELPQFINVLTGSMTIVGPRPHMILENYYYERTIKNYSFRYKAKPGITGLGQVNNRCNVSNRKKMEDRIFWDILYIKNWSEYLDFWIIYKTIFYCFQPSHHFQPSQPIYANSTAKI